MVVIAFMTFAFTLALAFAFPLDIALALAPDYASAPALMIIYPPPSHVISVLTDLPLLLVMLWLGGVCAVVAVVILVLLLVSLLPHGVLSLVVA